VIFLRFKNLFYLIFSIFLVIFLSGCNKNSQEFPGINSIIDKKVKITSGDEEYTGNLIYSPEGIFSINFESPENLNNFKITRNCDKYEISQGDLQGEFTKNIIQENSKISKIIEILDNINNNNYKFKEIEETERIYDNSETELRFDKNNNLLRIDTKNPEISIEFLS